MTSIRPSEHEYKTIKNIAADAYREYLNGGQVDFNAAVQESAEEAKQKLRQRALQMVLGDLGISNKEYQYHLYHQLVLKSKMRHSRHSKDLNPWQGLRRKIRALLNKFSYYS